MNCKTSGMSSVGRSMLRVIFMLKSRRVEGSLSNISDRIFLIFKALLTFGSHPGVAVIVRGRVSYYGVSSLRPRGRVGCGTRCYY